LLTQLVQTLKKENDTLRTRLDHKQGLQRIIELEDKLKESDALIISLKKEVRSL
jgi:hypothetical protein